MSINFEVIALGKSIIATPLAFELDKEVYLHWIVFYKKLY